MSATPQNALAWVKPVQDALMAVGLVVTLGVVFWLDRGKTPSPSPPPTGKLVVREVATKPKSGPTKSLKLAVSIPPEYDDMGKLLRSLGKGYGYDPLPLERLLDSAELQRFDVIFLTCGSAAESWLGKKAGEGERKGTETYYVNEAVYRKVLASLRAFVEEGGTLYASDFRFSLISGAFEEFHDPDRDARGEGDQEVAADVVSPGLKKILGDRIKLHFRERGWYASAFCGADCEVLLRGQFKTLQGDIQEAPLLVRFPHGKGTVIFTSFHNEEANPKDAEKLLRYLVFASVTADEEAFATKRLVEDGFQTADRSLLSASHQDPTITHTYDCEHDGVVLRVALAFQNAGAKLRLRIVDPHGLTFSKVVAATYIVEIPNAAAGRWTYSVEALHLPYANFPFTVSLGEKEQS